VSTEKYALHVKNSQALLISKNGRVFHTMEIIPTYERLVPTVSLTLLGKVVADGEREVESIVTFVSLLLRYFKKASSKDKGR